METPRAQESREERRRRRHRRNVGIVLVAVALVLWAHGAMGLLGIWTRKLREGLPFLGRHEWVLYSAMVLASLVFLAAGDGDLEELRRGCRRGAGPRQNVAAN